MIEVIKRKKVEKILLDLILVLMCGLNLVFNMNIYRSIFDSSFKSVLNMATLGDAINNNEKFVYVDLKNANLEHYSIEKESKKYNIYTVKLDDTNVLAILDKNTLITDKTPLEITYDNSYITDIKNKLKKNDYFDVSLSNVDYHRDLSIEKFKIYGMLVILVLAFISLFINLLGFIFPNKTFEYRKYLKNKQKID